jgi:hypothetical protein
MMATPGMRGYKEGLVWDSDQNDTTNITCKVVLYQWLLRTYRAMRSNSRSLDSLGYFLFADDTVVLPPLRLHRS